jgi:hypothetical protein
MREWALGPSDKSRRTNDHGDHFGPTHQLDRPSFRPQWSICDRFPINRRQISSSHIPSRPRSHGAMRRCSSHLAGARGAPRDGKERCQMAQRRRAMNAMLDALDGGARDGVRSQNRAHGAEAGAPRGDEERCQMAQRRRAMKRHKAAAR